jgi:hypothetical protein
VPALLLPSSLPAILALATSSIAFGVSLMGHRLFLLCNAHQPSASHLKFRCFVGNLGNEVDDNSLIRAFQSYPSFQRAKVIFDKRLRKTRGYGFVSFRNAECFSKALREMQVLLQSSCSRGETHKLF